MFKAVLLVLFSAGIANADLIVKTEPAVCTGPACQIKVEKNITVRRPILRRRTVEKEKEVKRRGFFRFLRLKETRRSVKVSSGPCCKGA